MARIPLSPSCARFPESRLSAAWICPKKQKSRASRLAKPDARHHGVRQDDPAHKAAASVDAVRVSHGVRRRRTRE